jgi:NAD(P)-dependent dehydrogenase (short-subunit alcohol dehydrogenase family)
LEKRRQYDKGGLVMSYVESMFSLAGRVAVVTGGAGTLPSVIAAGLAKAGASVCIWGRGTGHPIQAAVAALRADLTVGPEASGGMRIEGVTVDTGDRASVERAIAETEKLLGVPDLLVNGVGGTMGKSAFVDVDEEKFELTLKLNLLAGLVTPTRVFARYWIAKGVQGDVINMTSMTSYKGLSGVWGYNAAKAGVLNLNEGLARELAPHGIRVNAIAPGFFIGYQNRALLIDEATGGLTARGKTIIGKTPFGRFGEKEELCGAVLFLASRAASGFVTGVSIPVDGGYLTDNI